MKSILFGTPSQIRRSGHLVLPLININEINECTNINKLMSLVAPFYLSFRESTRWKVVYKLYYKDDLEYFRLVRTIEMLPYNKSKVKQEQYY